MELLDLPLEAVVCRLYSLPAAGAAWTCLAAVLAAAAAAAAGLWRFRSSSTTTSSTSDPSPSKPSSPPAAITTSPSPATTWPASPSPSPKVRYTAYFYESGCVGCCHVDEDGDEHSGEEEEVEVEEDDGVCEAVTAPLVQWEGMGMRRRTDLGWYMYQDLTALNGSIVRLWDGSDGGCTAASPRRRGRMGISAF